MEINRPPAEKRKISHKDDFEFCYLRHTYLRKVNYNPTETEMEPYMKIVSTQAKNTYYTYKNLFQMIGFTTDDIINIGRVHVVSFLGLSSLEKVPQKYANFEEVFFKKNVKEPKQTDIQDKNKANFTLELKQRMETLVRVCRQKARNIKGLPTEEFYVFYGPKRPPRDLKRLLENHEKYNFRKLDIASFKSIKKKVKKDTKKSIKNETFKFAGNWYVAVPLEKRVLSLEDFTGAGLDPYDSMHNKNPEELLFHKVEEREFEKKKSTFEAHNDKRKERILRGFIHKNKKNPLFKEEIATAREFLKTLGV